MIIDKENTFSDEQAITATADSTNVIDLGAAGLDSGEPLYINAQVNEAFTAAGAGTLTVSLVTATDAAFTTPVTLVTTPAIGKADLIIGKDISFGTVPAGVLQYVKLVYTVATGPMTAGKMTAFIGGPRQSNT